MIWPQLHSTSVFHFTFTSLRLPEFPDAAPVSVFPLFVLLVGLSEYQWSSLTDVLQTQENSD